MDAIAAMADQVLDDLGGVDILINNAGRSIRRSLELSYDRIHDYQRTMQLNYLGAVQLILKFIPGMRERGFGHIVNISSVGVQTRAPRFGAYIASKAALDSLCDALQAETVNDRRPIHHRAHGAGAHADDQPDHDVRQLPGAVRRNRRPG